MPRAAAVPRMRDRHAHHPAAIGFVRELVIGLIAFLTVVDLFATQAILPSLVGAYGVSPAAMGTAVNCQHLWDGRCRARRRILQQQDRSPAWHRH